MPVVKPVTGEDLVKLFSGKKFCRLLRKAASFTRQTGRAGAVDVYREAGGRLHYEYKKGSTDGVYNSQHKPSPDIYRLLNYLSETPHYYLLALHFHPDLGNFVCPSGPYLEGAPTELPQGDLCAIAFPREYAITEHQLNSLPIHAIGRIGQKGDGELLLLQERTRQPLSLELLQEVSSSLEDLICGRGEEDVSTERIVRFFNDGRLYKAASMQFCIRKRELHLPPEEVEKARIFAYQPAYIPLK